MGKFELFVLCLFGWFFSISAIAQENSSGFTFKKHLDIVCEGSEFVLETTSWSNPSGQKEVYWKIPSGWVINGELSDGMYYVADTNVIIQAGGNSGYVSATIYETGLDKPGTTITDYFTVLSASDFAIEAPELVCQNELIKVNCSAPANWCTSHNCTVIDSSLSDLTIKPTGDAIKVKAVSKDLCSFEDSITISVLQSDEIVPVNKTVITEGIVNFQVIGPEEGDYSWYPFPGGRQFVNKGSETPYDSPNYEAYVKDSTTLYAVYTGLNGCTSDTIPVTVKVLEDLILSSQLSEDHILVRLSSNPFHNQLLVEFQSSNPKRIEIHDIKGSVVETFYTEQDKIKLGESLQPGIYYLKVVQNNFLKETFRIVKI